MESLSKSKETISTNKELGKKEALNIADNYAKLFPKGYYIEIVNNVEPIIYNPNGVEIYNESHNIEKLVEKIDGGILYQVTTKSSVDLMIEEYGKNTTKNILSVPAKVMKSHREIQIKKKIVEIPKKVIIEKELPYTVNVEVEKEVDIFQQEICQRYKDLTEVTIPTSYSLEKFTSLLRDTVSILLKKSNELECRYFTVSLSDFRDVEVFNSEIDITNLYGVLCKQGFSEISVDPEHSSIFKLNCNGKFSRQELPSYDEVSLNKPNCMVFVSLQNKNGLIYLKLHDVIKLSLGKHQDYLLI